MRHANKWECAVTDNAVAVTGVSYHGASCSSVGDVGTLPGCAGKAKAGTPQGGASRPPSPPQGVEDPAFDSGGHEPKENTFNTNAAGIIMQNMYVARMAMPDKLRAVSHLSTYLTQWG